MKPPAGVQVVMRPSDELGTHPSEEVLAMLRSFAALAKGIEANGLTVTAVAGYQFWFPELAGVDHWYFYTSYLPFESDERDLYDRGRGKRKCIYDYSFKTPQYPLARQRLLFWRIWREKYEGFHLGNVMYWRYTSSRTDDVPEHGKVKYDLISFLDPRETYLDDTVKEKSAWSCMLLPPVDATSPDKLRETLRWKVMRRALDDHAYLTLLERALHTIPSTMPAKEWDRAQKARANVDQLIWRMPVTAGDHPYTRDIKALESLKSEIGDILDDIHILDVDAAVEEDKGTIWILPQMYEGDLSDHIK